MLLWNPNARGGGTDDNKKPKCFGILDRIIDCKVRAYTQLNHEDSILHKVTSEQLNSIISLQACISEMASGERSTHYNG